MFHSSCFACVYEFVEHTDHVTQTLYKLWYTLYHTKLLIGPLEENCYSFN